MPRPTPFRTLLPLLLLTVGATSRAATLDLREVVNLDLRELMEVEITTVARREQPLRESAAAVTVITAEEIRRSGAADLADLLRAVPGAHVARVDGNTWAVGVRGFNGVWSNRLHVLVDGRGIYNPLFGGVNWDTLNLPLENILRIEVVRGPGGTLWGANSANGVINIITRSAADTEGSLAQLELRSPEGAEFTLRHGGGFDGGGHWRVHAKRFEGDGFVEYPGRPVRSGEWDDNFGLRIDRPLNRRDTLRLEAEYQSGAHDQYQYFTEPTRLGAAIIDDRDAFERYYLLANWRRDLGDGEFWALQAYLQRDERDQVPGSFQIDTVDIDFQHHSTPWPGHRLSWGAGYRRVEDALRGSYIIDIVPGEAQSELFSAFVQDDVALDETLRLIVGAKFEENELTGFEWQPSVRLAWTPDEETSAWGAVTRAVRTPSRSHAQVIAHPLVLPRFPPLRLVPLTIVGDPEPEADVSVSWEAGLRRNLSERVTVDLAVYYNHHQSLLSFQPDPADSLLLVGDTTLGGNDYGVELGAGWRVNERWRLNLGYAWQVADIDDPPVAGVDVRVFGGEPEQLLTLRSYFEPAPDVELDAALYYTDGLPGGTNFPAVDAYWRADLRLGWHPTERLELSVTAQNLFDDGHPEYAANQAVSGEVPRSLFARVTWRF